MKTNSIILFFLMLFLQSCVSVDNNIGHKVFDINTSNISQGSLDDYFKLKEIIPLDTCKEGLLNARNVNGIIFIKDKIIFSDYSPRIRVFNKETGKLHKVINRSGRGPQEYSQRLKLVLQDGDYIVARAYNSDMMYYDVDGNFIKKSEAVKNSPFDSEIENISDGNFLRYVGLTGLYAHKDLNLPYYSAHFVSKDGKKLKEMIERSVNSPKIPFISTGSIFYTYAEDVYLAPISENVIYKYNYKDSLLKPLYTFNFDNIDLSEKLEAVKDNESLKTFIKELYVTFIFCVTKNYMVFSTSCGSSGRSLYILIDRKTQEIKLFDAKKKDGMNVGNMIRNYNSQAIKILSYSDLVDKDDKLFDTPLVKEIQKITSINEDMNAVLCIYEEK